MPDAKGLRYLLRGATARNDGARGNLEPSHNPGVPAATPAPYTRRGEGTTCSHDHADASTAGPSHREPGPGARCRPRISAWRSWDPKQPNRGVLHPRHEVPDLSTAAVLRGMQETLRALIAAVDRSTWPTRPPTIPTSKLEKPRRASRLLPL
ncbi:unnamed protein product [Ixodes persulcatus]